MPDPELTVEPPLYQPPHVFWNNEDDPEAWKRTTEEHFFVDLVTKVVVVGVAVVVVGVIGLVVVVAVVAIVVKIKEMRLKTFVNIARGNSENTEKTIFLRTAQQ